MLCRKCGGQLRYVAEIVSGSFVSKLSEDGEELDREFYGDSYNFIECADCNDRPDYTFTVDGKYKLI